MSPRKQKTALSISDAGVASVSHVRYRLPNGTWATAHTTKVLNPTGCGAGAGILCAGGHRWYCLPNYGDDLFSEMVRKRIAGCDEFALAVRNDGDLSLLRLDQTDDGVRATMLPLPHAPVPQRVLPTVRRAVCAKRGYHLSFVPACQEDIRRIEHVPRAIVRGMIRITILPGPRAFLVDVYRQWWMSGYNRTKKRSRS